MRRIIAALLAIALCLSLAACGKSKAAKQADNLIQAIGSVSLESLASITAGGAHTVAIFTNGTVTATGNNRFGQCAVFLW